MGYTKIVRYGDILEIYGYEKDINRNRGVKKSTKLQRDRRKKAILEGRYQRSSFSVQRARRNFFRLVHHNNVFASSIVFLTLTYAFDRSRVDSLRDLSLFFKLLNKKYGSLENKGISYIGVPELTKKARIHYHLLVYNLSPQAVQNERSTRDIQRLWRRGYVHSDIARDKSEKIAGYMAKYMAKSMSDKRFAAWRSYTCSRNIEKVADAGGNAFSQYVELAKPDDALALKVEEYNVPYLGTCYMQRYRV